MLGSIACRRTEESRDEMPSWVPDWRFQTSVNVDLSMRRSDQSKFFSASNNATPRLAGDRDERRLVLKGFVVATLVGFYNVKTHLNFEAHIDSGQFLPQRFQLDKWKQMYKAASSRLRFPASSIKHPEQADHLMASIWSKSVQVDRRSSYRRAESEDGIQTHHHG